MKHLRVIVSGASAVLLLSALVLTLRINVGDIPITSAKTAGVALSATGLAQSERIVVDYVSSGCRAYDNWQFVLLGGPDRSLAVVDAGGSYESGEFHSDSPSPIGAISLSARDCKGIDDLLRVYRHPTGTSGSTTAISIRVSYFRGDQVIGTEEFVDEGMVEFSIYQRDYEGGVPADSGVTPDRVSFPQLFRRVAEADAESSGSQQPTQDSG